MLTDQRPGSEAGRREPPTEHPSLALEQLLGRLERGGRHRLLDLGQALGENVQFFARRSCKLFIADLAQTLFPPVPRRSHNPAAFDRLLSRDLPSTGGRPVDLILAWDLLNYVEPDELEVLARHLSGYCSPGTQLFALISTRKMLPERPTAFRIAGPRSLVYENDTATRRACPLYKEAVLSRLLPAFQVETSFLLRNGMQEYLLVYEPQPAA